MDNKAEVYAIKCHTETNHMYDGLPYSIHLNIVVNAAKRYIHLIPENDRENVLSACWLHDTIEDCRLTYNDIKEEFNHEIAEMVYAVTNEKGRNREERANDKYYEGIRSTRYATFIKVCDRIANCDWGIFQRSKMANKYKNEMDTFVNKLYNSEYDEMFTYLKKLFN